MVVVVVWCRDATLRNSRPSLNSPNGHLYCLRPFFFSPPLYEHWSRAIRRCMCDCINCRVRTLPSSLIGRAVSPRDRCGMHLVSVSGGILLLLSKAWTSSNTNFLKLNNVWSSKGSVVYREIKGVFVSAIITLDRRRLEHMDKYWLNNVI